jgi:hypothetical protein
MRGTRAQIKVWEFEGLSAGQGIMLGGMYGGAFGMNPGSANPTFASRAGAAYGYDPARTYEPRIGAYQPPPPAWGGLLPQTIEGTPSPTGQRPPRSERASSGAPTADLPVAVGGGVPTTSIRPRASVAQLRQMMENSGDYFVWRTTDGEVAANQPVRFTGQNTPGGPNTPQAVHLTRGLRGLEYGKFGVIIKAADFRIRPTADAAEFTLDADEIPVNKGVWYTQEDYNTARASR